jgi:hypothetical protein
MPGRVLQNHYCVAALQRRLAYNAGMTFPVNRQGDEPGPGARRAVNPHLVRARFRRACLVVTAPVAVGLLAACAVVSSVSGGSSTVSRLQQAGYRDAAVHLESGSGLPADGRVDVSYSVGPAGNAQTDARNAERITWNTLRYRFGLLTITRVSGGCTSGTFCVSSSTQLGRETYAHLRAEFGSRPAGLDKTSASQAVSVPRWLPGVLSVCVLAAAAATVAAVIRARRGGPV